MRVVSSINGVLRTLAGHCLLSPQESRKMVTGFPALDTLLPGEGFALGAVHEVCSDTDASALLLPLLLARAVAGTGRIMWCDPLRQFYPPAAAALGLPLKQLVLIRPRDEREGLWAATESLRCAGVGMCVLPLSRLSPLQARRLQLAAEQGGGLGVVLRSAQAIGQPYAARTRWLVRPAPGDRAVQRCLVRLIHGHGGRLGESVLLEVCRETHHVRAIEAVARRTIEAKAAASA